MQKFIFYFCDADLTLIDWVILNSFGDIEKQGLNTLLTELSDIIRDKEAILITPSEDVLLLQATLPKLNRHKLRQALPYSLEDQLLTDVTDLHFAFEKQKADHTLDVAIISKTKIDSWLEKLSNADISLSRLIPATLLPPLNENSWHVVAYDNTIIARTGTYSGFGCDIQNLDNMIELRLSEESHQPDHIYLSNYSNNVFSSNFIAKKHERNTLIRDMASWLNMPTINLLQGSYLPKNKKSSNKKIWQIVGCAALVWIGLIFFSNIISFFILHHQASTTEDAINRIYKHHFPQASAVVEPKKRMADKLNKLSHQNQNNPSLLWLAYIGKSLSQSSGVKIKQLDFRNNQLTLEVTATSFSNLDTFTHALTQHGVVAKQQNVSGEGTKVKGTIVITDGSGI